MSENINTLTDDHLSVIPSDQPATSLPLVIDLDGTLIKTDSLIESFLALIRENPFYAFLVLLWLLRGRAYLKQQISRRVVLDVSLLPYNQELLNYLKVQRDQGRHLVLATGADEEIARRIADYLQIFDAILASDGTTNLSARRKRDRLVGEFGEKGFDYAGNDRKDFVVWSSAHKAIVVSSRPSFPSMVARAAGIERVFTGQEKWLKPYIRALRPHQWLKNLLVFLPLVLAHRFLELDLIAKAFLAFLAFSLCASSVYLLNDLADLPADRHHPRKRRRPFAAGELSLLLGLISIPLLFVFSLLVGLFLPLPFLEILALYYLLNLAYSSYLKRVVLLDVIVLAGLYTLRIMAGSASVIVWPSTWLLAFSIFLFLSLALVKRYAELVTMGTETGVVHVRGYQIMDKELLASLGSGSGYVAVLVFVIYISSGVAEIHYTRHHLIWFLCPLLLYWISYIWLIAHRGALHDDPLVFTVRDRISKVVILLVAIIFALAL
jgi:4-hydroxybenzoate polyprenyltransferase